MYIVFEINKIYIADIHVTAQNNNKKYIGAQSMERQMISCLPCLFSSCRLARLTEEKYRSMIETLVSVGAKLSRSKGNPLVGHSGPRTGNISNWLGALSYFPNFSFLLVKFYQLLSAGCNGGAS